jgi:hypothetical protein
MLTPSPNISEYVGFSYLTSCSRCLFFYANMAAVAGLTRILYRRQCYENCSQWTGGRIGFSGNGGPHTKCWSTLNNSTFASRDYEMKYCELVTNKYAMSLPTEAMFGRWLICKVPVFVHLINPRMYDNFWQRGKNTKQIYLSSFISKKGTAVENSGTEQYSVAKLITCKQSYWGKMGKEKLTSHKSAN